MKDKTPKMGRKEFIFLMALLMSFVAFTIDAMLPALNQIGDSLGVADPNKNQMVISFVFLGISVGLLIFGPISDSFGRKKTIHIGMSICIFGSLVSYFSGDLTAMLIGRILQGFGAASCRIVTVAMIRDQFEGREMGCIMSQILVFFILVPALAPSLGQAILFVADWRAIFGSFVILGLVGSIWLHFRKRETLDFDKRRPFSKKVILAGMVEALKNPIARTYMFAAGFIFGAFVGYLTTAQQILQIQYGLGDDFAFYFGVLALAIGLASFLNSKLLMKYRMETICFISLGVLTLISFIFYFYSKGFGGHPDFLMLMIYLGSTFFCMGLLFGNFNTLALQQLGHIAGTANSVVGFVQTLISMFIGVVIGQFYNETVDPVVLGFLICGFLSWIILVHNLRRERALS